MSTVHDDSPRPGANDIGATACRSHVLDGRRDIRAVVCSVAFIMVLAIPFECSADRWYEDYEKAVDLIKDGECSREALQLLGAAVVDKPKPKLSARTIAVKTVDYLPYFQLARAHFVCGEIDSARHYIEVSRERGVAPSDRLDALERRLVEIESPTPVAAELDIDPDELAALAREATEIIGQTIAASQRVNSKKERDSLASFFAENRVRLNQASNQLSNAQEQLSVGTLKRDRSAIESARETALQALKIFSDVENEVDGLRAVDPTPQPMVAAPSLGSTPTSSPPPSPSPVLVAPIASRTPAPIRPLPPDAAARPREVPESLRRAAGAYLKAGYFEVIHGLEPSKYPDVNQQAAAHLLRAAAHFAIYCLDGRRDNERLGDVRREIKLSNDLDPSLRPDPQIFSPEFVRLFSRPG